MSGGVGTLDAARALPRLDGPPNLNPRIFPGKEYKGWREAIGDAAVATQIFGASLLLPEADSLLASTSCVKRVVLTPGRNGCAPYRSYKQEQKACIFDKASTGVFTQQTLPILPACRCYSVVATSSADNLKLKIILEPRKLFAIHGAGGLSWRLKAIKSYRQVP